MESGPNSGSALASEYALRVALQTMKERCVVLQRRLAMLEEDNQELRERTEQSKPGISSSNSNNNNNSVADGDELLQLRIHVAELNRQKQQLSEHINMVSNENRKLWSRLSQIAKDKNGRTEVTNGQEFVVVNEDPDDLQTRPRSGSGANQNLIRSKTFTQHSPNPNLRHKLIPNGSELSMEEVALDNYEQKGELVQSSNDFAATADDDLGFAYLNVDGDGETGNDEEDFNNVAKKCMEGLQEMRREAIKQQRELTSTLTVLESKIALQPCKDCANKSQKPEMADKSLETDESLSEVFLANGKAGGKGIKAWPTYAETEEGGLSSSNEVEHDTVLGENGSSDNIQHILHIEPCDRLCPMCGKKFADTVPWEPFQQHVEAHFIEMGIDF